MSAFGWVYGAELLVVWPTLRDLYQMDEVAAQGIDIWIITPLQNSPSDPPAPRLSKSTLHPHLRYTNNTPSPLPYPLIPLPQCIPCDHKPSPKPRPPLQVHLLRRSLTLAFTATHLPRPRSLLPPQFVGLLTSTNGVEFTFAPRPFDSIIEILQ